MTATSEVEPVQNHVDVESRKADGAMPDFDVLVIGAGISGLYALHQLRSKGLSTKVVERAPDVGGTWYWNTYPGARVDVQSLEYSYSFSQELEQSWRWTELYAAQPEILEYARHVAERFDLRRDILFDTEVTAAEFDESTSSWSITTSSGHRMSARFLVAATGPLSSFNIPSFKGLHSFEGAWYHTARWPQEPVDLAGKRVAVIGTGSTGVQLVPAVAPVVDHLLVFQRTPSYALPTRNAPMNPSDEAAWKASYRARRAVARASRSGTTRAAGTMSALAFSEQARNEIYEVAWQQGGVSLMVAFIDIATDLTANETAAEFVRNKIRATVADPAVAELLAPKDYPIGAKRVCLETGYYEAFNRSNVQLVDVRADPIAEVVPTGLVTESGTTYEFDVLIFATGFDAFTGALRHLHVVGRGGAKLEDHWSAGPRSYLGLAVSGFPNLFIVAGPGSPSVLSNMFTSIEQHVEWISDTLHYMKERRLMSIEAESMAENNWVDHVNDAAQRDIHQFAKSWYVGANIPGKPRVFMPYVGGVGNYREICAQVARNGYEGFVLK